MREKEKALQDLVMKRTKGGRGSQVMTLTKLNSVVVVVKMTNHCWRATDLSLIRPRERQRPQSAKRVALKLKQKGDQKPTSNTSKASGKQGKQGSQGSDQPKEE
ncbi:hypothetical protein NC651_025964 [Populus alba x Populus x berolinensis]|nr:hypothetical protein NC651_025964 [Populus alba x Populus x berolinensis]